jgi:hypothetical protein
MHLKIAAANFLHCGSGYVLATDVSLKMGRMRRVQPGQTRGEGELRFANKIPAIKAPYRM